MAHFKYEFLPVGTSMLVERSLSFNPDDVNRTGIGIVVKKKEEQPTATAVRFIVPLTLTPNPSSIAPVVVSHGSWQISRGDEANIFRAEPLLGHSVDIAEGEEVLFRLNDMEISTALGESTIQVEELISGNWTLAQNLTVRKIEPYLRIDYFVANADGTVISWATTGAAEVKINGVPIEREEINDNNKSTIVIDADGSLDISANQNGDITQNDIMLRMPQSIKRLADSQEQLKRTGTRKTYTLQIFGAKGDDSHFVSKQIVVDTSDNLGIGTDSPTAAIEVRGSSSSDGVKNGAIRAGSSATAFSELSASGLTIEGATAGTINVNGTQDTDNRLDFQHNGKTKLTLMDDGKLGLGLTNASPMAGRLTIADSTPLAFNNGNLERVKLRVDGNNQNAALHFDILDASGNGWNLDVLTLHGDGNLGPLKIKGSESLLLRDASGRDRAQFLVEGGDTSASLRFDILKTEGKEWQEGVLKINHDNSVEVHDLKVTGTIDQLNVSSLTVTSQSNWRNIEVLAPGFKPMSSSTDRPQFYKDSLGRVFLYGISFFSLLSENAPLPEGVEKVERSAFGLPIDDPQNKTWIHFPDSGGQRAKTDRFFTLPEGFRPQVQRTFLVNTYDPSISEIIFLGLGQVTVETSGDVRVLLDYEKKNGVGWQINLDGISFPTV